MKLSTKTPLFKLALVSCVIAILLIISISFIVYSKKLQAKANQENGSSAALARKPSAFDRSTRSSSKDDKSHPDFLNKINSLDEFNTLARVYNVGTDFVMPHSLFLIERNNNKIFYINTVRFPLHETFIKDTKLFKNIITENLKQNYSLPERQFIFGTLSWQNTTKSYVFEFWEGDNITPELLQQTQTAINQSFFEPVKFKTNSTLHQEVAENANIPFITQADLIQQQAYLPLNIGESIGKIRILDSVETTENIQPNDIVLLKEVPISLPPVAGVITEQASTLLSHVNILAKGWKIPNMYLRDASTQLKTFDNQWVKLKVSGSYYTIEPITQPNAVVTKQRDNLPKPNLILSQLIPLSILTAENQAQCGAKATNLGILKTANIANILIPDGFCIPFAQYAQFMEQHQLAQRLEKMHATPNFQSSAAVRKQQLAKLREEILTWEMAPAMSDLWINQWNKQLNGQGVFVRSSSNSEDLPNFSGAGLYSTAPNIKSADELIQAVKYVWASVFNFEAYEARRAFGLPHNSVYMSVLVQTAVDSESSGVLITQDPYDATRSGVTYISAKRGVGIRVVEGQRIAEQILYTQRSDAIQVLSHSAENTELRLNQLGGVEEVQIDTQQRVLTDERVRRLAKMGESIKKVFNNKNQDIEWAIKGDQVILLQSRPYQ